MFLFNFQLSRTFLTETSVRLHLLSQQDQESLIITQIVEQRINSEV